MNMVECPSCGARVNYVVDPKASTQMVLCTRCKREVAVARDDVPERVWETLRELDEAAGIFEDEEPAEQIEGDAVEEALSRVSSVFADARDALVDFDEKLNVDVDIAGIAEQYAPETDLSASLSGLSGQGEPAVPPVEPLSERDLRNLRETLSKRDLANLAIFAHDLRKAASETELSVEELIEAAPDEVVNLAQQTLSADLSSLVERAVGSGQVTEIISAKGILLGTR